MMIDIFKVAYIDIDEGSYDTLDDKATRLRAEGMPHEYRTGKLEALRIGIDKQNTLNKVYKLILSNVITPDEYDELYEEKVNHIEII